MMTFKTYLRKTTMSRIATFFTILCCFTFSSAYGLENVNGVQITPLLKTTTSWNGAPIQYPTGQAEISGMTITIAPGVESGWHTHPAPSFGVVLEGELDIMLKTGETKHIKAGDSIVEVVNTLHTSKNNGHVPVKLIVFYAGAVGQKLTVKENAPH
jgi:quercetin dioxygenase-like cupin family protein